MTLRQSTPSYAVDCASSPLAYATTMLRSAPGTVEARGRARPAPWKLGVVLARHRGSPVSPRRHHGSSVQAISTSMEARCISGRRTDQHSTCPSMAGATRSLWGRQLNARKGAAHAWLMPRRHAAPRAGAVAVAGVSSGAYPTLATCRTTSCLASATPLAARPSPWPARRRDQGSSLAE